MHRRGRPVPCLVGALVGSLVGACHVAAPVVVAPIVAATPAPPQVPVAPTRPAPLPLAPPAAASAANGTTIRVLLRTGETSILPEPGRRYLCEGDNGAAVVRGPLEARSVPGVRAVQVGAFARRENAETFVSRLRNAGIECEIRPSRQGLHAVVAVGRAGESSELLEGRLRSAGVEAAVPVPADGEIELWGEAGQVGRSRRFVIHPQDQRPVDTGEIRVRGDLEFVAADGGVALINVVGLEEYLRGVVPAEMGPRAFPAIEALKAQAVAARTYAVAHRGEYGDRGYDICATTACQVYQGVSVEHTLSDRAVAETAGLVATWEGRPIDAMYHSTCGGHTEDAAVLLPDRAAPYLRGVPCRGDRAVSIGGTPSGWLGELDRLVLVAERVAATVGVQARADQLARRLGGRWPQPGAAGLASAFDLGEATVLLQTGREDTDILELLRMFKLAVPPPDGESGRQRWELAFVVRLAQLAGVVEEREGRIVAGPDGPLFEADGAGRAPHPVDGRETVLERQGSRWRVGGSTALSGSPAALWCVGGACPVIEVAALGAADARSAWNWWAREITLVEAAAKLGVESLVALTVASRGRSGRATSVVLSTAGGTRTMAGFELRLRLGLPDTLFTVALVERESTRMLRFLGRGWGHGIGMCQNGAYGLAVGGAGFEEIIKTYYTGVTVEAWAGGLR